MSNIIEQYNYRKRLWGGGNFHGSIGVSTAKCSGQTKNYNSISIVNQSPLRMIYAFLMGFLYIKFAKTQLNVV